MDQPEILGKEKFDLSKTRKMLLFLNDTQER
jgi:hypothetical protein